MHHGTIANSDSETAGGAGETDRRQSAQSLISTLGDAQSQILNDARGSAIPDSVVMGGAAFALMMEYLHGPTGPISDNIRDPVHHMEQWPSGNDPTLLPRFFGMPLVITSHITNDGRSNNHIPAIVGAFRTRARIYQYGGITISRSGSNESNFLEEVVMLRASTWVQLHVLDDAAFRRIRTVTS